VKYHLIPHLAENMKTKEIWDSLINLYKNENENVALRDKLHNTRMTKGENVASYLTWIKEVKDELCYVGEIVPNQSWCA
jgi:hypothetical protein